jgi:hypothetical protein
MQKKEQNKREKKIRSSICHERQIKITLTVNNNNNNKVSKERIRTIFFLLFVNK